MYNPSSPIRTYYPSGIWKPIVFLIAVIGVVIGAISGFAYQWLVNHNPLVYFNVLASFGAAWLVGTGAYLVIKASQCRNIIVAGILSLIFGFSAVASSHYVSYRHWLGLYYKVANDELKGAENLSKVSPEVGQALIKSFAPSFKELTKIRIEEGWSFQLARNRHNNGSGVVINGPLVPLIWLIEAAIFIIIAISIGIGSAKLPFCESCECWADQEVEIADYPTTNHMPSEQVKGALNLGELFEKPETNQRMAGLAIEDRLIHYKLNICPVCQKLAFLSISEERMVLDRRGQEKKKTTDLWRNVVLDDDNIDPFLRIHRPDFLEEDQTEEESDLSPPPKRPDSVSAILSHFK